MENGGDQHSDSVRVDQWAWAVRLFKSRSLVAAACKNGHVTVNDQRCRPAKKVRVGDIVAVKRGVLTRTVEIKLILDKRVGASRVEEFLTDRTPPEEYERAAEVSRAMRDGGMERESGAGRPTKKDRRNLDELMDEMSGEKEAFERIVKAFIKKR